MQRNIITGVSRSGLMPFWRSWGLQSWATTVAVTPVLFYGIGPPPLYSHCMLDCGTYCQEVRFGGLIGVFAKWELKRVSAHCMKASRYQTSGCHLSRTSAQVSAAMPSLFPLYFLKGPSSLILSYLRIPSAPKLF